MNFEPDAIILSRLIPWIEESKLRIAVFDTFLIITGIILIYVWLKNFFIPIYAMSTIIGLFMIVLALVFLNGNGEDINLAGIKAASRFE
ncbi:MAG: hypothetical protein JSW00_16730 [Thermoplasmata archaeon]|nr:MAG: hypothetical protein JSW00_16730 [Thermoplasmata archaeon]